MQWNRLLLVATAVLLAICVAVSPAAATGHLVIASEHTTDTDFQNASVLDNLEVNGTGEGAQLDLRPTNKSDTADRGADTGSFTTSDKMGITIETRDRPIENLTAYRSAETTDPDIYYLYDENENELESDVGGESYTFDTTLEPNTKYYIAVDDAGGSYTAGRNYDWAGGPATSAQLNITSGYDSSQSDVESVEPTNIRDVDYDYNETDPAQYVSAAHDAEEIEQGFVDLRLHNVSADVEWQAHDGSSWTTVTTSTYTTSGTKTDSLSGDYDQWRINVSFSPTNADGEADLYSEGVEFNATAPEFDNSSADPPDVATITESETTFTINLSDADFATAQGDEVTATLHVDGSSVGTDTLTANGTASVTHEVGSIGDADYHWEAEDSYGETAQSATYTITTPSNVTFRREDNASEIVTGADVTATFYSEDGQTIVERTDDDGDGNISLSGLPNTEFVVVVEATGYYDRRVYIESIFEQQDVYLLNTSDHQDAVDTTFVYEDRTGSFPPEDTTLRVQRAVDPDNDSNFTWQTIAGDYWGAAGEFPFSGEYQARYRIVIENPGTGRQRIQGTHIPTADGSKNIIVGQIQWGATNGTGRFFDAEMDVENNQINFLYVDPGDETRNVRVRVHARRNTSDEVYDENFSSGPYGRLEVVIPVTENQSEETWVVNYTADHDSDGDISGQTMVGGGPFGLPVDPWFLGTLGWVFVTFVACGYGPRTATMGAWALVGFAGILMLFQWVDIPISAFVVAAAVAAGGTFYREGMP